MTSNSEHGHPAAKPKLDLIAAVGFGGLGGVVLWSGVFSRSPFGFGAGVYLVIGAVALCLSYHYDWYLRVVRGRGPRSEARRRRDRFGAWLLAITGCLLALLIVLYERLGPLAHGLPRPRR